jgi:hypothetical protein
MARKAFTPSEEQRHWVEVLSSYHIRQEDIAMEVGLLSPKTLRKHFREDLNRGWIKAEIKVRSTFYAMATSGKLAAATIQWLCRYGGWGATPVRATGPAAIPDFVVAREKEAA